MAARAHGRAGERPWASRPASSSSAGRLPARRPVPVRLRDWREVYEPFPEEEAVRAGGALHGLRHPLLPRRMPARQPHPGVERPRLPGRLARGPRTAPRHQQLPGVHGAAVPRAVRGVLRARHQRRARRHRAHRVRDRRAGLVRGLGAPARPAVGAHGQVGGGRRVGPGGPGRGPAAGPGRAQRASSTSGPSGPAGSCATASRNSRWRRRSSTGGWTRCRPRAWCSAVPRPPSAPAAGDADAQAYRSSRASDRDGVACATDVTASFRPNRWRRSSTRSSSPAAPPRPRDLDVTGPRPRRRPLRHGVPEAVQPGPRGRPRQAPISATGKHVVIIGGGDTGADCLGTAHRQGAASVHQLEILPRPPDSRGQQSNPWPTWPLIFRTSSAHEEGGERIFAVQTTELRRRRHGAVRALRGHRCSRRRGGRPVFEPVAGSEFEMPCELVLLAMGFVGAERRGVVAELGVDLDARGNVAATGIGDHREGVFVCGDMTRGQSLIVWAIAEGRSCAASVDRSSWVTRRCPHRWCRASSPCAEREPGGSPRFRTQRRGGPVCPPIQADLERGRSPILGGALRGGRARARR